MSRPRWGVLLWNGLVVVWRQRAYHLIGVLSLTAASAVSLALFVKIHNELNYERWVPHGERIHRIEATTGSPGQALVQTARSPGIAYTHFAADLPQAEHGARAIPRDTVARVGSERVLVPTLLVDPGFLNVFAFEPVAGQANDALRAADSVVLTETEARRLFGPTGALGQTLFMQLGREELALKVTAVIRDLPVLTHLRFGALVALRPAYFDGEPWVLEDWSANSALTYVKSAPGVTQQALNMQLSALVARHRNEGQRGDAGTEPMSLTLSARPLLDIRLNSSGRGDLSPPGSGSRVLMMGGIVLGVLAMAAMNHASLAAALALRRSREIALRRVFGASRASLAGQALAESLVLGLLAAAAATVIALAAWPWLADMLGEASTLNLRTAGEVAIAGLGFGLVLGLLGGVMPALYFGSVGAASTLYAEARTSRASVHLRSVLCAIQVALAVGLLLATVVVFRQAGHLTQLNLGFRPESLFNLYAAHPGKPREVPAALLERLKLVPGVTGVGRALVVPGETFGWTVQGRAEGEMGVRAGKRRLEVAFVDDQYFAVMGVPVVSGRALAADQPLDDVTDIGAAELNQRGSQVVIDTQTALELGYASPQQAVGQRLRIEHWNDDAEILPTIVGVVGAHQLRPSTAEGAPARVYLLDRGWANNVVVRCSRCTSAALRQAWDGGLPAEPFRVARSSLQFERLATEYGRLGRAYAFGAVVALLIAVTGLCGLVAHSLAQREKETALRRLFGASTQSLLLTLVAPMLLPVLAAVLMAVPLTMLLLDRWLAGFASRIDTSPLLIVGPVLLSLLVVAMVVVGQTLVAAWKPPAEVLRRS